MTEVITKSLGQNGPVVLEALQVKFTPSEASQLDSAFAPDAIVGLRYPEFVLKGAAQ